MTGLVQEWHREGRDGPSPEEAARVILALAEIVGSVHRLNPPIVHRDLKPGNILVTDLSGTGRFRITDFGIGSAAAAVEIAATMEGRSRPEASQPVSGYSALYAPPQQRRGNPAMPQDDIYALGVIWYQLLTGDLGIGAPSGRRWSDPLAKKGMSAGLIDLLADCLEQSPTDRPATAFVLAERLRAEVNGAKSIPPPVPVQEPPTAIPGEGEPSRAPAPSQTPEIVVLPEITTANATKEQPWENSLGMKFVPVPGTDVLFSIWETRVKDYRAFVEATGHEWSGNLLDHHPATDVSWHDAVAFCEWLSQKEGMAYRLPTDHEWSCAVGIGDREDPKATPEENEDAIEDIFYPWGTQWPPPRGVGNYGAELKVDNFKQTSPVGTFPKNQFGLHDMGGNVWEWCEDCYDSFAHQPTRVLRGASWRDRSEASLRSAHRFDEDPSCRDPFNGFRVVISAQQSENWHSFIRSPHEG